MIWEAGFITWLVGTVLFVAANGAFPFVIHKNKHGWQDGKMADVKPVSVTITGNDLKYENQNTAA